MAYSKFPSALLVLLVLVAPFSSQANAASVAIIPTGNPAVFSIEGTGMDGVAGIQFDITYAASLANPTVTQGALVSGAMFASNTSIPRAIKVAIIRTNAFSGSGQIAKIVFSSGSGTPPTFTSYSFIDSTGKAISTNNNSVTSDIILPAGVPFSQPATPAHQPDPSLASAPAPASGNTPTYLGSVTLPSDQQQRPDSEPTPPLSNPLHTSEATTPKTPEQTYSSGKPATDAKTDNTSQYNVYKGALDRFKQYSGSRTLISMTALFDKKVAQNIHQEPAILLNNGQDRAILTLDIPARMTTSPNFAVNGGSLVAFKQDKKVKGRWIVEVLPEAGAVKVLVTIIAGTEEYEYPLTVATPAKTSLTLDERGWKKFLAEIGTVSAPMHDLNNDGVRDYVDEFIFVANYLLNKGESAKPSAVKVKGVKK